jgi:hypothetical protein
MYITKLYNVTGDDYCIHKYVMRFFPGNRPLFQVNGSIVTTYSNTIPVNVDSKFIKEVSVNPKVGDAHLFTLRISPTKRDKNTHKIVSIDNSLISEWVKNKAIKNGFNIDAMKTEDEGFRVAIKKSLPNPITLRSIFITGMLSVQDPLKFNNTVYHGLIGARSKGLGFGMLNIF